MGLYFIPRDDYLMHHGIKGQKWGIRRYQNPDGSLTPEGIKRYGEVLKGSKGFTSKGKARNARDKIQIELIEEFYKRNPKPSRKEVQEGMAKIEELTNRLAKEYSNSSEAAANSNHPLDKAYTNWTKKPANSSKLDKYSEVMSDYSNKSAVTRRVMNDWHELDEQQFRGKYHGSKELYAKRVARYGDPYMNAPLAKLGKKLGGKRK